MRQLGKVPKQPKLVPHELTERDRERRMDMAWSLLCYSRTTAWLDSIVNSDEKWVFYENKRRKLQWVDAHEQPEPSGKADLHPRKIMLCVWWSVCGVILFENCCRPTRLWQPHCTTNKWTELIKNSSQCARDMAKCATYTTMQGHMSQKLPAESSSIWTGNSSSPTILSGYLTYRLPPLPFFVQSHSWQEIRY